MIEDITLTSLAIVSVAASSARETAGGSEKRMEVPTQGQVQGEENHTHA
jgi:hypothetical protein